MHEARGCWTKIHSILGNSTQKGKREMRQSTYNTQQGRLMMMCMASYETSVAINDMRGACIESWLAHML